MVSFVKKAWTSLEVASSLQPKIATGLKKKSLNEKGHIMSGEGDLKGFVGFDT